LLKGLSSFALTQEGGPDRRKANPNRLMGMACTIPLLGDVTTQTLLLTPTNATTHATQRSRY